MKFLLDAQLPFGLVDLIHRLGHQAQHVRDLPRGTRTPDLDIAAFADRDGMVLVTKDRDFVTSQLLSESPRRLLVIAIGNMSNPALFALIESHWTAILAALQDNQLVEMGASRITARR